MHLIAIRMFVESILRYGLPPAYQAAVLIPVEKSEARLRVALNTAFGGGGCLDWGRSWMVSAVSCVVLTPAASSS